MATSDRRGGGLFVFEGEVAETPRVTVDEKTGEIKAALNLTFWGGSQYVRLSDVSQAKKVAKGSWVRCECSVRTFKENTYAGAGTITHVDGAAYKAG